MKYRLIAIDMDDTLLNTNHQVSKENEEALHTLEDMGIKVVFCSGRPTPSLVKKKNHLKHPEATYLISFNGAAIHQLDGMVELFSSGLSVKAAHTIVRTARKYNITAQTYKGTLFYTEKHTPEADEYSRISGLSYEAVGKLEDFINEGPLKILLNGSHETLVKLKKELEPQAMDFNMVFSKPHYLEFLNPKTHKGSALAILGEKLGIKADEMIAMGDSYNDIEMLEYAGLGIAVANARKEVKAAADMILKSDNDNNTLVEVLNYIRS